MRKVNIESRDGELPADSVIELRDAASLDIMGKVDINDPHIKKLIDEDRRMRAFMEDIIEFSIAESHDSSDERIVEIGVNGDIKKLERGKTYRLARKFIDSLIKVTTRVSTHNYKDRDLVDQTSVQLTNSLRYPLQIHHDPAGDTGRRWFLFKQRNP